MQHTFLERVQIAFIELMAKIKWHQRKHLSVEDQAELQARFTKDYYIIVTRKSNYFTTFLIALGNWMLTGRWGFYSHALMNLEDEVTSDADYRFIEATGKGTNFNTFDGVFEHVDAVGLVLPKAHIMSREEWTECLDKAKTYLGTPYDNLFDLRNSLEINCVELVRLALQALPDYNEKFPNFEAMLARKKKLVPDMFTECEDFEVVFTVKK